MDVKVGDGVAEHEGIDVLGAFAVVQHSGKVLDEYPEHSGFLIRQLFQPLNVASRLDHQVAEIYI
jgi:hypothetical protein